MTTKLGRLLGDTERQPGDTGDGCKTVVREYQDTMGQSQNALK